MNSLHKICVALLNLPESKRAQLQLSRINVDKPVSLELSSAINPDFHWKLMETYSKGTCLVNMDNKRFIQVEMNPDGTFSEKFLKQFGGILERSKINLRSLVAQFIMVIQNLADETDDYDVPIIRYTNINEVQIYPEVPDISTSKFVIEDLSDGSLTYLGDLRADHNIGANFLRPLSKYTRVLVNLGYYTNTGSENGKPTFVRLFKLLVTDGSISFARYTLPGSSGKQKLSMSSRSISIDELDKTQTNSDVIEILTKTAKQIMATVSDVSIDPTRYPENKEVYILFSGDHLPDNGVQLPNETDMNGISPDEMTPEQFDARQKDLLSYYKAAVTKQTDPAKINRLVTVRSVVPDFQQHSKIDISGIKATVGDSTEHDRNTVIEYSLPQISNGKSAGYNTGFAKLYIDVKPEYKEQGLLVFPKATKQLSLYIRESPYTKKYQPTTNKISSFDDAMITLAQMAANYMTMSIVMDSLQSLFDTFTNKFVNIKAKNLIFQAQDQYKAQCTVLCTPLASEMNPFEIQFVTEDVGGFVFDTRVTFEPHTIMDKEGNQVELPHLLMWGEADDKSRKQFMAALKKASMANLMHIRFGDGRNNLNTSKNQSDAFIINQSRYATRSSDPKTVLAKSICKDLMRRLSEFWISGGSLNAERPKTVSAPNKGDERGAAISTSIRLDQGNSGIITVMDSPNGLSVIVSFGDNDYYELPYESYQVEKKGVTTTDYRISQGAFEKFLHWYMNVPRNAFAGRVKQAYKRDLYAGNEEHEVNATMVEDYCHDVNEMIDDSQSEGGELLSSLADFGESDKIDQAPDEPEEPDTPDIDEADDDTYA